MSYHQQTDSKQEPLYQNQSQPYILREDEKLPLFLIKLWNIVEDPAYFDVIRWDDVRFVFQIKLLKKFICRLAIVFILRIHTHSVVTCFHNTSNITI